MKTTTDYKKIASHEAHKGEFKKCILLYSGGLDSSILLKWIQEHYQCEVITLTVDLGKKNNNFAEILKKATDLGATKIILYDAKEEFANELLSLAIKANADYQGGYALSCPLGRVIIAKIAVQMAKEHNCPVIAHGCTGKGNDQVRFESYITTLNPTLKTIAPVREWSMGRNEQIKYAKKNNIPITQNDESPYSHDENIWGNTSEGAEIEETEKIPIIERILKWCTVPEKACYRNQVIKIEFYKGIPIALNDKNKSLIDIISELNTIGAAHGVGILHMIEDRITGLKVRGVYEQPAASILVAAHKNLEQLVSTIEENEMKNFIDSKWAYLTYTAKWYDPIMQHLKYYIESQNNKVSGTVKVKLYKGNIEIITLESKYSLLDKNLATFDKNGTFNQNASAGFIEIYNLAQKISFQHQKKHEELW
ncbi:argininosuccinate synthase [Candidatus Gracilibacteria bacterium]|nr:argininosuccinate synthase [Candidatus Gracilibacteria bacterium]